MLEPVSVKRGPDSWGWQMADADGKMLMGENADDKNKMQEEENQKWG